MSIASGEVDPRARDCCGPPLTRAARVKDAGHGGQILAAASTVALVDGFELIDLGPRRLRDLSEPLQIFQVCADGLGRDFPPLTRSTLSPVTCPPRRRASSAARRR